MFSAVRVEMKVPGDRLDFSRTCMHSRQRHRGWSLSLMWSSEIRFDRSGVSTRFFAQESCRNLFSSFFPAYIRSGGDSGLETGTLFQTGIPSGPYIDGKFMVGLIPPPFLAESGGPHLGAPVSTHPCHRVCGSSTCLSSVILACHANG